MNNTSTSGKLKTFEQYIRDWKPTIKKDAGNEFNTNEQANNTKVTKSNKHQQPIRDQHQQLSAEAGNKQGS